VSKESPASKAARQRCGDSTQRQASAAGSRALIQLRAATVVRVVACTVSVPMKPMPLSNQLRRVQSK